MRVFTRTTLASIAALALALPCAAQTLDLSDSSFEKPYLVKMMEPDALFRPLSPPAFVKAEGYIASGDPAWLKADDWCIVVDRPEGSQVYPVPVMLWHEVANDRGASKGALCVSYCILTGTALVFDEDFGGGTPRSFGVSGYLYNSNLVMFDYQTRSLWSQAGLAAMSGPAKGAKLPIKAYRFMRWSEARAIPGAAVCEGSAALAAMRPRYTRPPVESFSSYPTDEAIRSAVRPEALEDRRFPLKELFAYFPSSGRAVSLSALEARDISGIEAKRKGGKLVSVSSPEPFITVYWFALRAFYPEAKIEG